MKRIAVMVIVLLMIFSNVRVTQGHYWRLRYSPYAFNYNYPSGLVPYDVYYSPYAFSYKHPSGLVSGSGYYYPYVPYGDLLLVHYFTPAHTPVPKIVPNPSVSLKEIREKRKVSPERIKELKELREKDGKEIISAYLRSKNIAFRINNGFFVKNETVGLDFFLEDRNIIIKYQNPGEIQILGQRWTSWEDACEKNRPRGWRIYEIKSCQKDEILAKLILILK